jgi:phosphatidylserine/phosphatidylglycerophosphate/cardiolipin synthase-like enzyme
MPDTVNRKETTHIDEVSRTAQTSTQWLLENRNRKGAATHPITHNNKLHFFICGEEGFADIAIQIAQAERTIDLICWGFDPGMELVRDNLGVWPRGKTYGELLLAAAERGVQVRLLVWYDELGVRGTNNMPGISYAALKGFGAKGLKPVDVTPQGALDRVIDQWCAQAPESLDTVKKLVKNRQFKIISHIARQEYCARWYNAAFNSSEGAWKNIVVRTRGGDADDIKRSLQTEPNQPGNLTTGEFEQMGMKYIGTHHQKTILIDYTHDHGSKAVGYVMGLNSVTDYWDTALHKLEDPRREQGVKSAGENVQRPRCSALENCGHTTRCTQLAQCMNVIDPGAAEVAAARKAGFRSGFRTMIPYQDYACRIARGAALLCVHTNFVTAWDRAGIKPKAGATVPCDALADSRCVADPAALLVKAVPGDSTVQIVRTQPQDQDKTIKELYMLAAAKAALGGYLYAENQYFQYQDWTQHLMQTRNKVVAAWGAASAKAGKKARDMPVMHVLIVIPFPERDSMVPRTYDALAALGQQRTMTGQHAMIERYNNAPAPASYDAMGVATGGTAQLPAVVENANGISKPDLVTLQNILGTKVSVAMLQTCGIDQERWRYREIYIHSKLLMVNDSLLTLGSANLNQRSMAVDSEINIATDDPVHARDMRKRVWSQLSGGMVDGGSGSAADLDKAFERWTKLMESNKARKLEKSQSGNRRQMTGFLLPLDDNRNFTMRLG